MHVFISAGIYFKHRQGVKNLKIFEKIDFVEKTDLFINLP